MPKINDSRYFAVEQNPAYSRTQLLDPFRDRTHGKTTEHNRYLPFFQPDQLETSKLPILHGQRLRDCAGDWRRYFFAQHRLQVKKLIVEVGCYKGKNLVEMACAQPDTACIGIDYTFKRVVLTAQRLHNAGISNAVTVLYDAHALPLLFAGQQLDGLICFFPDPWNKRKQSHNRLWSKDFCANVANILADDAYVWLKTDVASFFQNAKYNLEAAGLSQRDYMAVSSEFESEFEARYRRLRRQIYAGVFSRQRR